VPRDSRVKSARKVQAVNNAGRSIAGLYTLVATCEARGINPFAYLADVIPRVQDHPKRRLDELLPGPWARARAAD